MKRMPANVSPITWTQAQILTYGGVSVAIVAIGGQLAVVIRGWSRRMTNERQLFFGLNLVPAGICFLLSACWLVVAFGIASTEDRRSARSFVFVC